MLNIREPGPLTQIAVGAAVSLAFLATLGAGCGSQSVNLPPQVAQVALCKLDALRVLPSDPKMVTPYDIEDLVGRLQACKAMAGDGGIE